MEAIAAPLTWSDLPEHAHPLFKALRSPEGERLVLEENIFIEKFCPKRLCGNLLVRSRITTACLSANSAKTAGRCCPGRASLRSDGEPAEVVKVSSESHSWLAQRHVPKLFINGEPGTLARGRLRETIRRWPNQSEVTVKGRKLLQEDSPDEIGAAIADFVKRVRGPGELRPFGKNTNKGL